MTVTNILKFLTKWVRKNKGVKEAFLFFVNYVQPKYGIHKVVEWDEDKAEFLLDLDGQKFWSNPFRIQNCG